MERLKTTKLTRLPSGSVPPSFHLEVARQLSDYCVALGRMTSNKTETFEVFGSGTLVVRDGMYGVLTAYHCLHSLNRELKLGNVGDDQIFFIYNNGKVLRAAQHEVDEQVLGRPKSEKNGPDLTFIRIPVGPLLSAFNAVASFAPLNRDITALMAKFCVERAYIANLGYPEHRYSEFKRTQNEVQVNVTLVAGAGSLRHEDIERRGAWDFIKCPIDFRALPHLPKKYNGMSGGGIWAVLLAQKNEKFVIQDFALIGVTYYQSAIQRGRGALRGHFVRSIYQRAWRKSYYRPVSSNQKHFVKEGPFAGLWVRTARALEKAGYTDKSQLAGVLSDKYLLFRNRSPLLKDFGKIANDELVAWLQAHEKLREDPS